MPGKASPANTVGTARAQHPRRRRKLLVALLVAAAIVVAGASAFFSYVGDYYHADDTALAALQSTDDVQVSALDNGDIAFVPSNPQAGIVFYPGGKVQAESYAPLMQDLAECGFLCVVTPMPFNLAVFDIGAAGHVQEQFPQVSEWILMGHSLGGSMAAACVADHPDQWGGLVLLAAYSTSDLSRTNLRVLTIYGDKDGVLNRQKLIDNVGNLPGQAAEFVITGGNHAQFGNYGEQAGDGEASLPAEAQQEAAANEIADYFLPTSESEDDDASAPA